MIGSDGVDSKRGWVIIIIDNKVTFRNYYTATNYEFLESTVNVRDGSWHSIALTHDASSRTYRLYIDGIDVANGIFNRSFLTGTRVAVGLKIWRGNSYGLKINSLFDSLREYTSTKTATEILALHNFLPAVNEIPITEVGITGIRGQLIDSGDTTPIPILPDIRISTIEDFEIDMITPQTGIELQKIQIENTITIESIDEFVLDNIDIGLIEIDDIEFEKFNLEIAETTLPELEINELPTIDIVIDELETPDVNIVDVIDPVITAPISEPDPETGDPVITTPTTRDPNPNVEARDNDKYFTAVNSGTIDLDIKSKNLIDSNMIAFWINSSAGSFKLIGTLPLHGVAVPNTLLKDYKRIEYNETKLANNRMGINHLSAGNIGSTYGMGSTPIVFTIDKTTATSLFVKWYGLGISTVYTLMYTNVPQKVVGKGSRRGPATYQYSNYIKIPWQLLPISVPTIIPLTAVLNLTPNSWNHIALNQSPLGLRMALNGQLQRTTGFPTTYNGQKNMPISKSILWTGIWSAGIRTKDVKVPYMYNQHQSPVITLRKSNVLGSIGGLIDPTIKLSYNPPLYQTGSFRRQTYGKDNNRLVEINRILFQHLRYRTASGSWIPLLTKSSIVLRYNDATLIHEPKWFPASKIQIKPNGTHTSDVRLYDGSMWSGQLVRSLAES